MITWPVRLSLYMTAYCKYICISTDLVIIGVINHGTVVLSHVFTNTLLHNIGTCMRELVYLQMVYILMIISCYWCISAIYTRKKIHYICIMRQLFRKNTEQTCLRFEENVNHQIRRIIRNISFNSIYKNM